MTSVAQSTKPPKRSHQWNDARNLAMCRMISQKIRRQPELFRMAIETLEHWKRIQHPAPPWLKEWDRIFRTQPREKIMAILMQESEEGNRLRQSDPFCGILTEQERLEFLDRYDAE